MTEKRLKTLLYNALVKIEDLCQDELRWDVGDEIKWWKEEIGITKKELKEIEFI